MQLKGGYGEKNTTRQATLAVALSLLRDTAKYQALPQDASDTTMHSR